MGAAEVISWPSLISPRSVCDGNRPVERSASPIGNNSPSRDGDVASSFIPSFLTRTKRRHKAVQKHHAALVELEARVHTEYIQDMYVTISGQCNGLSNPKSGQIPKGGRLPPPGPLRWRRADSRIEPMGRLVGRRARMVRGA